ncbi:MAG: hypothetical protein ED557_03255 [Balneola sp.]|nr:MAG: hypothetical protein ED557_03255 [Balneola sp.]
MSFKSPISLSFSKKRKKRALTLVTVLFFLQLCLIWPIYPLFSSPTPQILGFPLSIIWVILILVCSFSAVLIFFLKDTNEEY